MRSSTDESNTTSQQLRTLLSRRETPSLGRAGLRRNRSDRKAHSANLSLCRRRWLPAALPLFYAQQHGPVLPTVAPLAQPNGLRRLGGAGKLLGRGTCDGPPCVDRPAGEGRRRAREPRRRPPTFNPEIPPDSQSVGGAAGILALDLPA